VLGSRLRRAGLATAASVVACAAIGMAAPDQAAAARFRPPRADSLEYRRNWPLESIGAQAAYAAGLSGRGVRIAMVDSGVFKAQRDLLRNLSRESGDVVEGRAAPPYDPHMKLVASPLAAALNGRGMVGLAYNAILLSVRADFDGGFNGECAFYPRDVARAVDFALDRGARIVVLPLQSRKPLGEAFEKALARAAASNAVVVIAAGNRSGAEPAWPARYAADPRYAGAVVVAGAGSYYGGMTGWSNKAGAARARFIVAPGEWVITDCGRKCSIVSGTSFSATYFAGATALMMEAHPELTASQAADRLLEAARDAGDPGADSVFGRGMLDLGRAFPRPGTERATADETSVTVGASTP
jgi:subtilisin family serine protease